MLFAFINSGSLKVKIHDGYIHTEEFRIEDIKRTHLGAT